MSFIGLRGKTQTLSLWLRFRHVNIEYHPHSGNACVHVFTVFLQWLWMSQTINHLKTADSLATIFSSVPISRAVILLCLGSLLTVYHFFLTFFHSFAVCFWSCLFLHQITDLWFYTTVISWRIPVKVKRLLQIMICEKFQAEASSEVVNIFHSFSVMFV